jgi:cell wall-associated NlpC family hydrolase
MVRTSVIVAFLALLLPACGSTPVAAVKRVEATPNASDRAASHAMNMVGRPYRMGGESASTGFDCSGLVQFSYRQAGVAVPRSTELQLRASRSVSRSSLRRGDLVFFDQEGKKKSHVGIYLGDGRFVHAPSSGKQVRVDQLDSRYWQSHLSDVRRF